MHDDSLLRERLWLILTLLPICASLLGAEPIRAEPVDLTDPTPRWVHVRFEASPEDAPGRLDSRYTRAERAWLRASDREGRVEIVVSGQAVERSVLAGSNPRTGSFSDFIWTFDTDTGDVIHAETTGIIVREVSVGLLRTELDIEIRVDLATSRASGFRSPKTLFGERVFDYCEGSDDAGCTIVPARRYDPSSGYVNAVGRIAARSAGIETETFAPVGEAVFLEIEEHTEVGDGVVMHMGWEKHALSMKTYTPEKWAAAQSES